MLAACLLLGVPALSASAAELPFTDVPENAWYREAVSYVYENKLFQGNSAVEFAPNAPMTRAMFVQVLANKTTNYTKADWSGKTSFSDVRASAWYAAPIEWASKAGLVSGTGKGRFDPETNVTREQMAVILYHYAQKTGNDTSLDAGALNAFPDAASVSGYAREAMQWAVTHRIIKGSDGKLVPKSNAKRCEVAQVAVNADPILDKTVVEVPEEPEIPDGEKFATIEEFVNSDVVQEELKALKDLAESSGMKITVKGQGDKLVFSYAFPAGTPTEGLADALKPALEAQASVFTDLAAQLKEVVAVEDPKVVVVYTDSAGKTIDSREFTAA